MAYVLDNVDWLGRNRIHEIQIGPTQICAGKKQTKFLTILKKFLFLTIPYGYWVSDINWPPSIFERLPAMVTEQPRDSETG